ncbi:MAG: DUF1292 domain-containing protein [Oscillospiraceae bacterium]|nr:DUF1292 domain-containing protein [Oscillospiraceae bacterium]
MSTILEQLMDENNVENIILYSENNEQLEFEQIALIPIDGDLYAILRPVPTPEWMRPDEALVFEVTPDALQILEDDLLIDRVFEEYNNMLNQ